MGSLRDREVACSASDYQGLNFELCVWRAVSSHHPQEVFLAQFNLYVHKGGLKRLLWLKASCLAGKSEIAGSSPTLASKFQRNKRFVNTQYCGEPPRRSVLGLRLPGPELPIMCSGGQCHLTILKRSSWPSLAYMCTKVA